jgi:hypothetical protein
VIDLSKLVESKETTVVEPSNNIFERLGHNTYDYKDVISELIDNSIAARRSGTKLLVTIDLYVDQNNSAVSLVIKDNASGITQEQLGTAISPAGAQSANSLNEHGLGMKQAVAALGQLNYLATKTLGEGQARVIREFRYGNIQTYYVDWEGECGTEIAVNNLRAIVTTNASVISRSLVPYLGARYRRFLKPDNSVLELVINLRSIETGRATNEWRVSANKPVYFHPNTRVNSPVIHNHRLRGSGWEALLTFGYAPREAEYEELELESPSKFDPYNVSLNKQGLDVILHDRVILFHQLSELGVVNQRHPDFNHIRGEIDLIRGFHTAITKNAIIEDRNFRECVEQVRLVLQGEKPGPSGNPKTYLRIKTYPDQIPEPLLRDRLATWLQNNPLSRRDTVETEYVVEGVEGYIDILADGEAWELKTNQARALDVYQLFMYMDIGDIDIGYLVAPSFTTGAAVAARRIQTKHDKKIGLVTLDKFPINQSPDAIEREEYY